jgi:endonuclease-8
MPEGDAIKRIANALAPLVGQTIERATTQGLARDLAGRTVTAITTHGKHLVIELSDAQHIRVHLGMNGRFRSYVRADGDAIVARMSPGRASLVLATASHVYLWRTAPTIEITSRRAPRRGEAIATLGPDVLAGDFDCRQAAARAALHESRTIGEVLLDQRVVAGIGNIWKTESLFAAGVDPRRRVGELAANTLAAIYDHAQRLMTAALGSARPALAIYSRTSQPCPRCATAISAYQLGDPARWTWSCARCQPRSADSR